MTTLVASAAMAKTLEPEPAWNDSTQAKSSSGRASPSGASFEVAAPAASPPAPAPSSAAASLESPPSGEVLELGEHPKVAATTVAARGPVTPKTRRRRGRTWWSFIEDQTQGRAGR